MLFSTFNLNANVINDSEYSFIDRCHIHTNILHFILNISILK